MNETIETKRGFLKDEYVKKLFSSNETTIYKSSSF